MATGVDVDDLSGRREDAVRQLREESRARLAQARQRRAVGFGAFAVLLSLITYAGIEECRERESQQAGRAERAARDRRDAACAALALKEAAIRRELDRKLSFAQTEMERAQLMMDSLVESRAAKRAAVADGCPEPTPPPVPPPRPVRHRRKEIEEVTCPCGPSGDCSH